jgi:hypothetical protein
MASATVSSACTTRSESASERGMTERAPGLPTLTEVVDLAAKAAEHLPAGERSAGLARAEPYLPPSSPTAAPADKLAYDEELVAQVMVRLQPRLEAWVEAQVRRALMEMLPVWAESASLSIVRDLRAEMPELLSVALDEVHRQRHGAK